jgi:hypothetical protein
MDADDGFEIYFEWLRPLQQPAGARRGHCEGHGGLGPHGNLIHFSPLYFG